MLILTVEWKKLQEHVEFVFMLPVVIVQIFSSSFSTYRPQQNLDRRYLEQSPSPIPISPKQCLILKKSRFTISQPRYTRSTSTSVIQILYIMYTFKDLPT